MGWYYYFAIFVVIIVIYRVMSIEMGLFEYTGTHIFIHLQYGHSGIEYANLKDSSLEWDFLKYHILFTQGWVDIVVVNQQCTIIYSYQMYRNSFTILIFQITNETTIYIISKLQIYYIYLYICIYIYTH